MLSKGLLTTRLFLRRPLPSDVEPWTAILAEPGVARYWPRYDRDRVQRELVTPEDDTTVLAIETRAEGEVIGAIQYGQNDDPQYRHAGIDLFLGTRWHGRGLGSEAVHAVVRHLFDALGHHRLVIDPAADNRSAIGAYERVGFRTVGLMRSYERGPDGAHRDGLLMELLADDYRAHLRAMRRTPTTSCRLRRATEADVPALLPMMVAFNRHEGISWDPEHGVAPLRRLLTDPDLGYILLIEREPAAGRPLGYAVVTFGFDLEFGGRDAFLTELYLEPEARGHGLGKFALDQLLREAASLGVNAIHLQVRAENTAAQRLYRAAGFTGTTRHFFSKALAGGDPATPSRPPR